MADIEHMVEMLEQNSFFQGLWDTGRWLLIVALAFASSYGVLSLLFNLNFLKLFIFVFIECNLDGADARP